MQATVYLFKLRALTKSQRLLACNLNKANGRGSSSRTFNASWSLILHNVDARRTVRCAGSFCLCFFLLSPVCPLLSRLLPFIQLFHSVSSDPNLSFLFFPFLFLFPMISVSRPLGRLSFSITCSFFVAPILTPSLVCLLCHCPLWLQYEPQDVDNDEVGVLVQW